MNMSGMGFSLESEDKLTKLCRSKGVHTWKELTIFVQNLPYGRNKDRSDFSLVLKEEKGTCSSKHALLKQLADLNKIPDVQLILGMYKMNEINTSKIGSVLSDSGIEYIPEAHCYLKVKGERHDFTSENADISKLENDILEETEISPEQVVDFKVAYHIEFLKKWLKGSDQQKSFEEIWELREQCIRNLSARS